jgi:general L-amino acid transport system permease protein
MSTTMTTPPTPSAPQPAATPTGPPVARLDPVRWARTNLFSSPLNTLLTLVFAPLLASIAWRFGRFLLVTARWDIIEANLTLFVVGGFPRDQLWRLWVALSILAIAFGLVGGLVGATTREAAIAAGRSLKVSRYDRVARLGPPALLLATLLGFARTATPFVLTAGVLALGISVSAGARRLPVSVRRFVPLIAIVGVLVALYAISGNGGVSRRDWGGLLITSYYTIGALVIAYPIGILLALGRRSTLPMVRWVCTAYIEFFRGSPLITLLFTGWLVLPFFLPAGFRTPTLVTRALTIFVLFTAAYVAEIVRGGLQGVGRGQWEAAQALGLSPWKQTRLVVLPQALRSVIPGLVGQAISLFKDTTLVLIIGQQDLLAIAQTVTKQGEFLGKGYITETLFFVGFVYWVASYWMSKESQRLEVKLGVGQR